MNATFAPRLAAVLLLAVLTPPTASPAAPLLYPDLKNIIPLTDMSIVTTNGVREFRYTHDILNAGPGPLEIQPSYSGTSGNYTGVQRVYSKPAANTWSLDLEIPVAAAFVFHAPHGHFHFPLASFGLYAVQPDGSVGAPVAMSPKNGFCIDNSFLSTPGVPNEGAFLNHGSCSDPLSLRGLSVGYVDDYNYLDPGQSIPIPALPNGTYWFRAIVDPNGYLAEGNEANNITDVKVGISGSTVQVLSGQIVSGGLAPPTIDLISPPAGAVSGIVQLKSSSSTTGAVQYLLDGAPLGTPTTNPPAYDMLWDSASVSDGTHTLAAQVTVGGVTGTSAVVSVFVDNVQETVDTTPPLVQITNPLENAVVSGVVPLSATASDSSGIKNVQFYVDGSPFGLPDTLPPFTLNWNTGATGAATLGAQATDNASNLGLAAPVHVTVDNTLPPPALIGVDVMTFKDAQGVLNTPAFSTTKVGDLLVAFVGFDGPTNAKQTATVSGAGLTWTLVKRSNSQFGTAEIWSAKANGLVSSQTVRGRAGLGSYHGSLTVVAFSNAAAVGLTGVAGASSGPPLVYIPGVAAGNWVWAMGNDWDRAVARTPVSGQVIVRQRLAPVGDTFWVQRTSGPAVIPGVVEIKDTAPINDQWNYAAVEIVAKH